VRDSTNREAVRAIKNRQEPRQWHLTDEFDLHDNRGVTDLLPCKPRLDSPDGYSG
jgi:hypothetical protein